MSDEQEWPLYVSPIVLSLFGRLALSEQDVMLRQGSQHADTTRAVSAWKKLITQLGRSGNDGEEQNEKGKCFAMHIL